MEAKENTSREDAQETSVDTNEKLEKQSERKNLDIPLGFAMNTKSTFTSDFSDINDKSRNNSDFHDIVKKYQLTLNYGAKDINKTQDKIDELVIQCKCDCILF
ncbi:hypothetical protein SteCoe_22389 [Stentor coeruleus]|uniref:Uncharacterized protein n=1 Tax=Stentor coeruleus TaxID=5963 RepID=A0A1R2BMF8_9CILI|nr:hypothetical protein SteCoe_22389 [Stentor coeruleus]